MPGGVVPIQHSSNRILPSIKENSIIPNIQPLSTINLLFLPPSATCMPFAHANIRTKTTLHKYHGASHVRLTCGICWVACEHTDRHMTAAHRYLTFHLHDRPGYQQHTSHRQEPHIGTRPFTCVISPITGSTLLTYVCSVMHALKCQQVCMDLSLPLA